MIEFFDSHMHINDEELLDKTEDTLKESQKMGMKMGLVVGFDLPSSILAYEMSRKYPFIYAACGVHPHDSSSFDEKTREEISMLLEKDKVVALGEIGLDYHYDLSPRDVQKAAFISQLALAKEKNKPVSIHTREAVADTYEILKNHKDLSTLGVMHSCSESSEMVKKFLDLGMYISFSGVLTFKNAVKIREMAKTVPMDRMLVETDSPYLAPVPKRGTTNIPGNTLYVIRVLSEILGIEEEKIAQITFENAKKLFGINEE